MNFAKPLFTAVVLGALSTATCASEWVRAAGIDSETVFADMSSIRKVDGIVKMWTKTIYMRPRELSDPDQGKVYRSAKSLFAIHCDNRMIAALQTIRFADADASSESIFSHSQPDIPSSYADIVPESRGEALLTFACKKVSTSKK